MPRIMQQKDTQVTVYEHLMLRNFWEYYVLEDTNRNIKLCYVMGYENEMGEVPMDEIAPYIISRTKKLKDIAPATGWVWVD